MKRLSILTALLFTCAALYSQMFFNGELLYGNEWVQHERPYSKITIDEDGVYRVGYADLVANGFPTNFKGSDIQAFSFGQEQSIYVSTNDDFGNGDYIEFFGYKNDGALDAPLYQEPEVQQLNPKASMFSDVRNYFITWEPGSTSNKRYELAANNLGGNLPNVERFYYHNEEFVYTSTHIRPVINEEDVRYSNFFTTEGFGSPLQKENSVDFAVDNLSNAAPESTLKVRFGTNAGNHIIRTYFNNEFIESNTYNSYNVVDLEYKISNTDINNNNTFLLEGNASQFDKNSIAHISLSYPRNFSADNQNYFRFNIDAHSFKKYFEITDFNNAGGAPVVMDITNGVRVESIVENGLVKFVLDPATEERDIVVFTSTKNYNSIEKKNFFDYNSVDPTYVILTGLEMNSPDGSGMNWIQEYANFRRSPEGRSYDVQIVHAEDIIDQFGYGVSNHTIGIRNWSNYLFQRWLDWEQVFIVGKAHEYGIMKNNPNAENYVPTHGEPGSDNLMFSIDDNSYPEIGVGRLAAATKDQVKLYYDKMQVYIDQGIWNQSIEQKAWMKKIIHLSGGDAVLQDAIRNWLDDMANVIEESTFGAEVKTFQKTSNDPIESAISKAIVDEVNNGCSVLTFFGHSSTGTFDFSIEDPSQFDNEGKTPLIISLGCHSGNIHTSTPGISENFVLEPEKGAIAFLASSGTAYVGPQYTHGRELYDMIGDSLYTQPLGTILSTVMKAKTNNFDFQVLTLQQQLTFHGDPALILNSHETPDYTPDFATFRTDPEVVSGRLDSVDICFDIANLGKFVTDSLEYYLVHKYSTKRDTYYFTSATPYNRLNRCHTIPLNVLQAAGENQIEVYLDHKFAITETPAPGAEMNNSLLESYGIESFKFFVLNDNPIPFHPQEFAITNEGNLVLMASTGNGFVDIKDYEIEIDTTELFDSPLKQSGVVTAHGGLVKWQPNVQYEDRQVYYWRVRAADPEFGLALWNNSSFVHIDEYENGWNQSHLFQYLKDDFNNLGIDSTTRNFDYSIATYEFKVVNKKRTADDFPEFFLNSTFLDANYGNDIRGGIYLVVADPNTLTPLVCTEGGPLGSDTPLGWRDRNVWPFKTNDAVERQEIIDFVNTIPDDWYIIMFTIQDAGVHYTPELWEDELFELFEDEGATQIRNLIGNPRPYVFGYQKGNGAINELVANTPDEEINSITQVEGKWFEGTMYSKTIGPAKSWNKFLWDFGEYNQSEDVFDIRLLGVDAAGDIDTLATNITNKEYDLSTVNASEYPHLKLEIFTKDTISNTSLDLAYWRVVYEGLPEAVLNTTDNYAFHADTLQQGEIMNVEFDIDNISTINMDSMLVKYSIIDTRNNEIVQELRKSPIQAETNIADKFEYDTQDLNGLYELRIEINPDEDQPEQFSFNNRGIINFLVRGDNINPLLDVTFDGIRILDGDIISPSPMIKITLTDENANQLIENPENFSLTLESPDGSLEDIDVNGPEINFIPADPENGLTACIEYTPTLGEGEYTLHAQGTDATGNFSGDHAYSVSFNVFEDNLISNVLNYPNPFSTSTEFVFTLTGNQLPEDYHIKIMTVSGKVVKEITREELGPIRVGVNRSDYKWNGTDEYGAKLANGVYLYKFYTDIADDLDKFDLGNTDQYFKEGFGKLVIMR